MLKLTIKGNETTARNAAAAVGIMLHSVKETKLSDGNVYCEATCAESCGNAVSAWFISADHMTAFYPEGTLLWHRPVEV